MTRTIKTDDKRAPLGVTAQVVDPKVASRNRRNYSTLEAYAANATATDKYHTTAGKLREEDQPVC